jgi:hypothetical protein
MTTTQRRDGRSEEMTVVEFKDFLRYVYSFPTKIDASLALEISRPTLDAIISTGRGKKETINRIREILSNKRVA